MQNLEVSSTFVYSSRDVAKSVAVTICLCRWGLTAESPGRERFGTLSALLEHVKSEGDPTHVDRNCLERLVGDGCCWRREKSCKHGRRVLDAPTRRWS